VNRVVEQPEDPAPAHGGDRGQRVGLAAERARLEAGRLDQPDEAARPEERLQGLERREKTVGTTAVIGRHEHDPSAPQA
jgi:hypothetical protein